MKGKKSISRVSSMTRRVPPFPEELAYNSLGLAVSAFRQLQALSSGVQSVGPVPGTDDVVLLCVYSPGMTRRQNCPDYVIGGKIRNNFLRVHLM